MKINVEGIRPTIKEEIIKIVESIENPKFTYIDKATPIMTTLTFETDSEELDDCIKLVKATIKNSPNGKSVTFRVMPFGKSVYFPK